MSNLRLLVLLSLLLFPAHVRGEDAPVPPPQAPFFHLPDNAAWEVEVTYDKPPTIPGAKVQPQGPATDSGTTTIQLSRIDSSKVGEREA